MKIKEILNYDKEAKEADMLISDGEFEILCYAFPFENKNPNNFTLEAFMTKDIIRVEDKSCSVIKSPDGYYAYYLRGKIINIKQRLVAIGNIIINLDDDIPKDIKNNEFIEFFVLRIDYAEL